MKIAIIYHSETGNTEKVAKLVAKGAEKVEGVNTKCMTIDDVDTGFVEEAKVVFFGTPTYAGTYSWQMKKWLDTCKLKLAGKVGCVFATENYLGGGADNAELALLSQLLVKGMFVYSVGGSKGQPYTHFGAVCIKDGTAEQKERVELFAERVADSVNKLFK
ncbi:flavodoxin family protein [Paramaledivibacter caminithermalis]|jgi:NAD(P)H dehydrogenase (quinone)|uniref:NAD(P)H dehydrogenase (Quinone) n=1 Tax=Paramaledivibacter caminithermalis (strain DSM 15212 / CIP 107654 / DViRD3) TaxID=1121301 RepID=A0A1M6LYR4_PARC5|nr:flavodoxin family protein [Paramaledivibacter caminithermalis]SHJ76312.1 NAD(P)H dehydrogenase (quinone) [Paramaledivibacter caminithermalis DSM 15212]